MDKVCGHGNVSAVAGGDHGADYGRQDHGGHGGGKAREQQRGKYIFSGNTGKQSAPVHAQQGRNECDRDQCQSGQKITASGRFEGFGRGGALE